MHPLGLLFSATINNTHIFGNNLSSNFIHNSKIEDFSHKIILMRKSFIIGSLGNCNVILVYWVIRQRTTKNHVHLIVDFLLCSGALPLASIVGKVTHYTLHFVVSCKILRTVCCLFVTMSVMLHFVLLTISVIDIDLYACRLKQKLSDTISMVHQTQYDSSNKQ